MTALRWRDVTTFSRSDTVREPRTWQCDVRGEVRITIAPTDATTAEEAQVIALARLQMVAQSIVDAIEAARHICHVSRCAGTATHGPDGRAVACWHHAGNWPKVNP